MLFRVVLLHQEFGERFQRRHASHFVGQLGNEKDVEVLEEVEHLVDVLVLHPAPRDALATRAVGVGEDDLRMMIARDEDLVDDHGVDVDLVLGELLDQPLCLVHAQELGDAHGDEGGFVGVLEAFRHLVDGFLHAAELLLDAVHVGRVGSQQRGHLR